MGLLIFYITLALGVSFMCSILEAVVLSTPQTYVNILQNEGKRTADMWAHLKDDDSVRPLTAILTLNTIAHTMGAAGVGSQVQQIWGVEVLTAASAILTLAVLFLSEIIPKTLGAAYWKRLCPHRLLVDVVHKILVLPYRSNSNPQIHSSNLKRTPWSHATMLLHGRPRRD